MVINMDLRDKNDYVFIDLSGLDENIESEIKAILRSEVTSDVLKLPWDNGEKDYNSNSVIVERSEAPDDWPRYDIDGSMANMEVARTAATASMMTPSMPSAIAYGGPFVHVQFQEWPAMGGNAYTNSGTADPNAYPYISNVAYAPAIYPSTTEVINATSTRENDRRGGRGRNRKNDAYNRIVNANDMQQGYVVHQGQFNQISPMCHPGVSYIPYAVTPQQHPAAGRPIFVPSPQAYSQQQIHPHHNSHSHSQYVHSGYSTHLTANSKQHSRQSSSGQNYMNQDNTKNATINPKIHERKIHDSGHITAQQQFRPLTNNNENDVSKKTKSVAVNNGNTLTNNGHTSVATKKQTCIKKVTLTATKVSDAVCNNDQVSELIPDIPVAVNNDVNVVEKNTSPVVEPVLTAKSTDPEPPVAATAELNGTQGNDEKVPVDTVTKTNTTSVETKITLGSNTNLNVVTQPVVTQPSSSTTERTFASILKKPNMDNRMSVGITNTTVIRPSTAETSVNHDTTTGKTQNLDSSKHHNRLSTTKSQASPKTVNEVPVTEEKKITNSVESPLNDPATYRMGEFLLNYQMDKQTVSLQPRGLTNRSNYCYINSILQALLACPPFYNLLKALPYPRYSSRRSSTPLIDNMVKFVNEFDPLPEAARLPRKDLRAQKKSEDSTVDIQAGVAFEPSFVYTMLKNASCAGVFSVEGRQEDAEEFLSCLLNGISDEMLELMKQVSDEPGTDVIQEANVNYNSGDEEWKVMGPRNKGSITRCTEFGRTPLSDIFRGQLRSRIIRQGEQSTDNVQPFFTLQLDIEKAESVKSALEILVGKDQVEGMMCSKTRQQIKAWKQVTLEELPVILILHLKWFDYKLDGCSKIFKNVTYAIDLKIDSKFLSPNAAKKLIAKQKQYKLFAVTYHDGKEATKGHYVTDAFHVGYGAWVRYDDSSVKAMSENDVLNPTIPRVPYLLYYRRCDTIGNNQPNNNRTR